MKNINVLLLFSVFPLLLFSQKQLYKPYELPEKVSEEYIIKPYQDYEKMIKKPLPGLKFSQYKKFAEAVCYGKSSLFEDGDIIMGWPEVEDYLNKVLKQILPDSLQNNENIRVYIYSDADNNAFTIHDGSIYCNIGMLAETVNEAALAFTLAHELTHFINNDSYKLFCKNIKIKKAKRERKIIDLSVKKAEYQREEEKAADLTGFEIAEKAGYDIYYGISDFKMMRSDEELNVLQYGKSRLSRVDTKMQTKSLQELLETHPELIDRIQYLQKYLNSEKRRENKKEYIVSDENFHKMQALARYETLYLLLKDGDYKDCIEMAFKYYLLQPDDNNYVYCVLESLRRLIYLDYTCKRKGFLTDGFKAAKFRNNKGILHDIHFLIYDSVVRAGIKQTEILDTNNIAFETYQEAFLYFQKIAESRNIHEAYLTMALFNIYEKEKCSLYLQKYLAVDSIASREYATSLLNGAMDKALAVNNNDVIIIGDIFFLEKRKSGSHYNMIFAESEKPKFYEYLKRSVPLRFPGSKVLIKDEVMKSDLKNISNYIAALSYSTVNTKEIKLDTYYKEFADIAKGKAIDFYILNPTLWEFIYRNKLKSISYYSYTGIHDKSVNSQILNPFNVFYLPYFVIALSLQSFNYDYSGYMRSYNVLSKKINEQTDVSSFKLTPKSLLRNMKLLSSRE